MSNCLMKERLIKQFATKQLFVLYVLGNSLVIGVVTIATGFKIRCDPNLSNGPETAILARADEVLSLKSTNSRSFDSFQPS